MTNRFATTPFGPAGVNPASIAVQERVRRAQEAIVAKRGTAHDKGQGDNQLEGADKWQLLRALTEARHNFGLSDRTIVVLEALCSFHQERSLDGSEPLIVFPSNNELSLRTRGMAPATLRRHIAALVDAGLIIRRDSPNGKRYCRRDASGDVENAFGFDIAPFALAAGSIYETAERVRAHNAQVQRVRSEITIHLRDVRKTIDVAIVEDRGDAFFGFEERLDALSGRVGRTTPLEVLTTRCEALIRLRAEVEATYLRSMDEDELHEENDSSYQNMSANAAVSERHIQNSKPDSIFEKNSEETLNENRASLDEHIEAPETKSYDKGGRRSETADNRDHMNLQAVLTACPAILDYARDGISNWREFGATAGLVRSMLGVSPDAWTRAREHMGERTAIIVIACILERAEVIKSPGGYLRALTDKAEIGKFSVLPMLRALE